MMRRGSLTVAALALVLTACSYPTRNVEIATLSQNQGYRWNTLPPDGMPGTLVIVTASGGGTRAAVLEQSVLEAMNDVSLPNGKTLADEIDVLSSVSGGSVTAAYFTAHGAAGFPTLEKFLRKDGMGTLEWRLLNPFGLIKYSLAAHERIDPLIDYFDENLFHDAMFQSLLDNRRRPFLVLNAADMVEGVPFAFTQDNFDLLCSDLARTKLSTAVAASAAFPVALSPVTLTNYSHCSAENGRTWPPRWAQNAAKTSWYTNPVRVMEGRIASAYAEGNQGAHPKKYIHLLDGGIADNLGVAAPLRFLTTQSSEPSFLNAIAQGQITRIVFVMINARSASLSKLDGQKATPGVFAMLGATIDAGIDRTTMSTAQRVRTLLDSEFAYQAEREEQMNQPALAKRFREISANTRLIDIDFDAIADRPCRQAYHDIATSWTLSGPEIDGLLIMGKALLGSDPGFAPVIQGIGGTLTKPLPTVAEACLALPH